jgi:hypothetical protein
MSLAVSLSLSLSLSLPLSLSAPLPTQADLAELLIAEPDDLSRLLMSRINQCPPAAQAILESATRCAALRDDLSRDELDAIFLPLEPMLQIHCEAGSAGEVTAVAPEHRLLCGLYCDLGLTQKKSLTEMLLGSKGGSKASSSRKLLESSSSRVAFESQQSIEEGEGEGGEEEEGGGDHLDEVLGARGGGEEEYLTRVAAEEEAEARKEEAEARALEAGRAAINCEGLLGKKSPAHNLWQDRWFKLMTRVESDEQGEFHNHHTLLWYKKKGGAVIKSVSAQVISGMQLISSPRPLAYRQDNFRLYLTHDPEGEGGAEVREWRGEEDKESKYVFSVHLEQEQSGGKGKDKDMILKAKTVDLLLQWMNHFAVVRASFLFISPPPPLPPPLPLFYLPAPSSLVISSPCLRLLFVSTSKLLTCRASRLPSWSMTRPRASG